MNKFDIQINLNQAIYDLSSYDEDEEKEESIGIGGLNPKWIKQQAREKEIKRLRTYIKRYLKEYKEQGLNFLSQQQNKFLEERGLK